MDNQQIDSLTRQEKTRPIPLYLVFEGGGAKGIAHVAAWYALRSILDEVPVRPLPGTGRKLRIEGVAGTSAGAAVAALIAAGAKPSDIIDSEGRIPLFAELGIKLFTDLFGLRGWQRLEQLRTLRRSGAKPEPVDTSARTLIRRASVFELISGCRCSQHSLGNLERRIYFSS
jgi:predicted acylesterase/phospholipase RssA